LTRAIVQGPGRSYPEALTRREPRRRSPSNEAAVGGLRFKISHGEELAITEAKLRQDQVPLPAASAESVPEFA
jgi:hypothetical protein